MDEKEGYEDDTKHLGIWKDVKENWHLKVQNKRVGRTVYETDTILGVEKS